MAHLILTLPSIVVPGGPVNGGQELALDSLNLSYEVQRVSISRNLVISRAH